MRLQFWQVDHDVCLDDFPRHQVLVVCRRMRSRHQARVVAGDAKGMLVVGHRLEQAVRAEVVEHIVVSRPQILLRETHPIFDPADRASIVVNALEARIAPAQVRCPIAQLRTAQELVEVAALDRCIPDRDLRRIRFQHLADHRAYQRLMGDERQDAAVGMFIAVQHEVGFHDHARAFRHHVGEDAAAGVGPSQNLSGTPNR